MDAIRNIFMPFEKRKYIEVAVISTSLLGIAYLLSAAIVGILSTPGFSGTSDEMLLFGITKSFSMFTLFDYAFVVLFPILGGLLISHYFYQKDMVRRIKAKGTSAGTIGIVGSITATACAGCLIPVFGLVAFASVLAPVLTVAKIAALALLAYGLYVISKQTCIVCKIKR